MSGGDWQPTADREALQARGRLLRDVRAFFAERQVLEVETPLLGLATVTDHQIDPIHCDERFLQTSPEYAMKRLLAAGSGPIYQVCKAFREAEAGSRHNPEFSLLEWYRPGFDQHQLMREVAELVMSVSDYARWEAVSYGDLFQQHLGLDPHRAGVAELEACARQHLEVSFEEAPPNTWLDLLLSMVIEPQLCGRGLLFVYDYPASQAALARLRQQGDIQVGERFELYADGMELANGYCELTDAEEQAQRFQQDRARLSEMGKEDREPDSRLLSALEAGLPACSGVALGLDRLLMLISGKQHISGVLSFDWDRA